MDQYQDATKRAEAEQEYIPRMRTAKGIVAEIKALDPESGVTEYCVRQMVLQGTVSVFWAGRKALINLDDVLKALRIGQPLGPAIPPTGGIRRIEV